MGVPDRAKLIERVLRDVSVRESGCWIWKGAANDQGYGQIKVGGRKGTVLYVHRIMAGAEPGEEVLHTCDTPRCVNPEHLRLGTHRDNIRDMIAKGRGTSFDAINRAKTHCPNGHPYDLVINRARGPERKCRTCKNEAAREYRRRKRGEVTA